MKYFFLLSLLLPLSLQVTNKKQSDCLADEAVACDHICTKQINDKCGDGTDIKKSDQCTYYYDPSNRPKSNTESWATEFGENFHGCIDQCIPELEGDARIYMDRFKSCSAQILTMALFIMGIIVLII